MSFDFPEDKEAEDKQGYHILILVDAADPDMVHEVELGNDGQALRDGVKDHGEENKSVNNKCTRMELIGRHLPEAAAVNTWADETDTNRQGQTEQNQQHTTCRSAEEERTRARTLRKTQPGVHSTW